MQKGLRSPARPALIEDGTATSLKRGNAIDQADDLHPEVLAFARWFADWWLRRGCDLLAAAEGAEGRRAA